MKFKTIFSFLLISLIALSGLCLGAETWIETDHGNGLIISSNSSGQVADTTQSFNLFDGNGNPVTVNAHADDSGNYETIINCNHSNSGSSGSGGSGHRTGQAVIIDTPTPEKQIETVIEYVYVDSEPVIIEVPAENNHKCDHTLCILIILSLMLLLITQYLYYKNKEDDKQ